MAGDAVAEAKRGLRRRMREVRAAIAGDAAARARRSARIWAAVVDAVESRDQRRTAPAVMLFESLPTEPDTANWFADAAARGWTTYAPAVDGEALRVMPGDVDPVRLEVVVFPGLAFSADGRRLGQGGGHYDRFARRLDAGCLRIGVCFTEQLLADLPTLPHDERVDVVVTDASDV